MNIEKHRDIWRAIARENGWESDLMYVQVWVNSQGDIVDSVSFRGMTNDIVVLVESDGDCVHENTNTNSDGNGGCLDCGAWL